MVLILFMALMVTKSILLRAMSTINSILIQLNGHPKRLFGISTENPFVPHINLLNILHMLRKSFFFFVYRSSYIHCFNSRVQIGLWDASEKSGTAGWARGPIDVSIFVQTYHTYLLMVFCSGEAVIIALWKPLLSKLLLNVIPNITI